MVARKYSLPAAAMAAFLLVTPAAQAADGFPDLPNPKTPEECAKDLLSCLVERAASYYETYDLELNHLLPAMIFEKGKEREAVKAYYQKLFVELLENPAIQPIVQNVVTGKVQQDPFWASLPRTWINNHFGESYMRHQISVFVQDYEQNDSALKLTEQDHQYIADTFLKQKGESFQSALLRDFFQEVLDVEVSGLTADWEDLNATFNEIVLERVKTIKPPKSPDTGPVVQRA